MMDRVVVAEAEIRDRRPLEHAEEVHHLQHVRRGHGPHARSASRGSRSCTSRPACRWSGKRRPSSSPPRDPMRSRRWHGVQEPQVADGEMHRDIPGGSRLVVGAVVAPSVRDRCQDLACGGELALPQLSHERDEKSGLLLIHLNLLRGHRRERENIAKVDSGCNRELSGGNSQLGSASLRLRGRTTAGSAPYTTPVTASMTPRVRFAPSPTGYLHVGGARTALFNWLLRAGTWRHLHPPHRRHRRAALVMAEMVSGHSRRPDAGWASTGTRAPRSAARTRPTSSPSGSNATARRRSELLAKGQAFEDGRRHPLQGAARQDHLHRQRARADRVRQRAHRELRHPALGHAPDLSPVRGRGRHRHG